MSQPKTSYTVKEIDNILALGESLGLDQAAAKLLEASMKYFAQGKDDTAKLLRTWASDLQALADQRYIHPDTWAKPPTEGGRGV